MRKKIFIFFQYILPHQLLTLFFGTLATSKKVWLKNFMIKTFIRRYSVDMSEAEVSDYRDYPTFNAFFTRALKSDARPIDPAPNTVVSPVDGCISQIGCFNNASLLQAKNLYYPINTLLGQNNDLNRIFNEGCFATFYLSPKDYHRVHMPFTGTLRKTIYIPGKLFSVNGVAAESIPGLFTVNERLVLIFDTGIGPMAVIMIGAMIVGQIQTIWGIQERSKQIVMRTYTDQEKMSLNKGDLLGQFNLGSSVILLFQKDVLNWESQFHANSFIRMGETIGHLTR